MHRTSKGFLRALALMLLLVIMTGTLSSAYAAINYTGYVSLRLMDGEPQPGVDTRYKLTIRKSGTVTAVLTNMETGAQTTVLENNYSSAQNILLTVPGSLIEKEHNYSLSVILNRGGNIGNAVHTFSTVQPVSRVDALSVTGTFQPQNGEALTATFSLPFAANVTAFITNSSGAQVTVLAQNTPHSAGAHALTWSGFLADGSLAPSGHYTFVIDAHNAAGSSPVVTAPFQITGDTSGVRAGRVQGSIQAILLTAQPKDGEKAVFNVRVSEAGNYTLKIKDTTTGLSRKFTGRLQAGMNTISPELVCEGGHSYIFQMVHQASRKTTGKAQIEYTAHIDPPSISVSIPATLKAGYGAALPITFTTGTPGAVILYITDQTNSNVFACLSLGHQPKGTQTVYWNGLDGAGNPLASGTYHVFGESFNPVGQCYSNVNALSYESVSVAGTPVTQGVISVFGAAENPEPVERTPIKFRYQASVAGDLRITVRDVTNNGQPVVVYSEKTAAGARTITIPGNYFGVSTYEIEATLIYKRKTVGRAVAYVKPYLVSPAVANFACSDSMVESKWDSAYEVSFDTASTGYLHVRIEKGTSGNFVRYLEPGTYTPAGHHSYYWDGRDDAGNMVEPGDYRVNVCYIDSYGNHSNFGLKDIHFEGPNYPEGVHGYAIVGAGTHKTPIHLYEKPNGKTMGVTYGISATFEIIEDHGEWLYVKTSGTRGGVVNAYVKADRLQKVALTSPYRIEVCIDRSGSRAQTFYLYKDGQLVDEFKISSGRTDGTTPTGTFCLLNRKPYFTVLGGGGICYDVLRVVGGVCIHRIPLLSGSYSSTEPLLGSPASAGCVRVPIEKSTWLYENIPDTTLIQIYRTK